MTEKILWVLYYSKGSNAQFVYTFYAEDDEDAHSQARAFFRHLGREYAWEDLQSMPEGFGTGSSFLPGTLYGSSDDF